MSEDISGRLSKIAKFAATRSGMQRWPRHIVAEVQSLRGLGVPVAQISRDTGISSVLIYKWVSRTQSNKKRIIAASVGGTEAEVKIIEIPHRILSFHLRWHHLEVRVH